MRKKKKPAGLTRYELADKLGIGLSTVDKLIGMGKLRSHGARGPAKLYMLGAARAALREAGPEVGVSSETIRRDYWTSAVDFLERCRRVLETWVADKAWLPALRPWVAWHRKILSTWPARIAAIVGPLTAEEGARLDARRRPPSEYRLVRAVELQRLLEGPAEKRPWPPAADPQIQAEATAGNGIWIKPGGEWSSTAEFTPPPEVEPIRLMGPLLEEIHAAAEKSREWERLIRALSEPKVPALPKEPTTVEAARDLWRQARSSYREARVAVRRGHRRRGDVVTALEGAVDATRWQWIALGQRVREHAGDEVAVRKAADTVLEETLLILSTLGGFLPRRPEAHRAA